jgi:hypothetical protein
MNTPPRASANNDGIVTPSQGLRYGPNDPSQFMRSSENLNSANSREPRNSEVAEFTMDEIQAL